MDREKETAIIREWLIANKAQWPYIAKRSLLTVKTIRYIVDGHVNACQPSTLRLLKTCRRAMERAQK